MTSFWTFMRFSLLNEKNNFCLHIAESANIADFFRKKTFWRESLIWPLCWRVEKHVESRSGPTGPDGWELMLKNNASKQSNNFYQSFLRTSKTPSIYAIYLGHCHDSLSLSWLMSHDSWHVSFDYFFLRHRHKVIPYSHFC